MRRRWQIPLAYALLVLFAGTMLPGQALHLCVPCARDAAPSRHEHHVAHHVPADGSPVLAEGDAPCHDSEGCLICQFYSQVQLAAPAGAADVPRPVVADVPSRSCVTVAIPRVGLHNPRGPPQA